MRLRLSPRFVEPAIALTLFLLPIVTVTPALIKGTPLSRGDYISQHYILRSFFTHELRMGKFPAWDPWSFAGKPFAANPQSAIFYPLHWLLIPWAQSPTLPPALFDLGVTFDLGLLVMFTFLLLRRFAGRVPAVFGALLMFIGPVGLHLYRDFPTALATVTWWPLLLYALERIRKSPRDGPYWLLSLAIAMSWLAGFPPMFFTTMIGVVLYAWSFKLFSVVPLRRFTNTIVLGLGLAAIQLVPAIEFYLRSNKAGIASGSANSSPQLLTTISSLFTGDAYSFVPVTLGGVAIILVTTTWWHRQDVIIHSWWKYLIGATTLVVLIWFGLPVLKQVPTLYNLVRFPERLLVLPLTGLIALATLGLQSWHDIVRERPRQVLWLITSVFVLGVATVGGNAPLSAVVALFVGVTALLTTVIWRYNCTPVLTMMLVALIGVGTLLPGWRGAWPAVGTTWTEELSLLRIFATVPRTGDRVDGGSVHLVSNGGLLQRVSQVQGWDALILKNYQRLYDAGGSAVFNARWVYRDAQWQEQPALPRWWWPETISAVPNESAMYAQISSDPLALDRTSVALSSYPWTGAQRPGTIAHASGEPDDLTLKTTNGTSSVLVFNTLNYPGWRATVDGQATSIEEINGGLISVQVPAGKHAVRLSFHARSIVFGGIISLCSLFVLIFLQRRPHPRSNTLG